MTRAELLDAHKKLCASVDALAGVWPCLTTRQSGKVSRAVELIEQVRDELAADADRKPA